ncbi:MAG TPA: N-acetylmuramoyl-L-alanine amidase [Fimbriimonadaceae bacterium]|nr:N-acetylmuramoyl-L-alanine amidase [Fimbriimonadaceae bacterium]
MLIVPPHLPQPTQFVAPGRNKIAWVQSPNFNDRPPGAVVDTIVLHHTASTSLAGTVRWFESEQSHVSAHFTVGRDGSIVQQVSTYERAWHAGESRDVFGRTGVNDFSVGIEIEHPGTPGVPYTDAEVEAVEHLVSVLVRRFPIRLITSHMAIALPAGRKPDPIDYPWRTLYRFGVEIVP